MPTLRPLCPARRTVGGYCKKSERRSGHRRMGPFGIVDSDEMVDDRLQPRWRDALSDDFPYRLVAQALAVRAGPSIGIPVERVKKKRLVERKRPVQGEACCRCMRTTGCGSMRSRVCRKISACRPRCTRVPVYPCTRAPVHEFAFSVPLDAGSRQWFAAPLAMVGHPLEMERRAEMKYRIENIRASLSESAPERGKMRHDRPPEPLQMGMREVADDLDREVEKSDPNVKAVVESTIKIGEILKRNVTKIVENAVMQFFNELLD